MTTEKKKLPEEITQLLGRADAHSEKLLAFYSTATPEQQQMLRPYMDPHLS